MPISNTQLADALEVSCEYITTHDKKDPAGLINLAYLAAIALRMTEEPDENAPEEYVSGEPSGAPDHWGESVTLENTTERLQAHSANECYGDACTIHHRTEHRMRTFPQHWRGDLGVIERMCIHGVGHPDPDNPFDDDDPRWLHGCDGCCRAPLEAEVVEEEVVNSQQQAFEMDLPAEEPNLAEYLPSLVTVLTQQVNDLNQELSELRAASSEMMQTVHEPYGDPQEEYVEGTVVTSGASEVSPPGIG